jgi:hypothetical protein
MYISFYEPSNFRKCLHSRSRAKWAKAPGVSGLRGTRRVRRRAAGRGVAVAGWEWDQSKEEIKAVRMVSVRTWQWQY